MGEEGRDLGCVEDWLEGFSIGDTRGIGTHSESVVEDENDNTL